MYVIRCTLITPNDQHAVATNIHMRRCSSELS